MLTNTAVTIYNKYIDGTTHGELFQRTVILAVAFENRKASNVIQSGGKMAVDQASIFIPMARGIFYLKPAAWKALAVKTGWWTLRPGDIIVKGEVSDELHPVIPAVVSPPTAEVPAFTVSDLRAKYLDETFTISSVDTMDNGSYRMRHWKVGAQ